LENRKPVSSRERRTPENKNGRAVPKPSCERTSWNVPPCLSLSIENYNGPRGKLQLWIPPNFDIRFCAFFVCAPRPQGPMPTSARWRGFRAADFFGLRRGNALRGPLLSARAERRGRKARQREGLFTKPPFPLESFPPRIVFPLRLTDAVRAASLCSARAFAVRREMPEDSLHRELACGYAETTPSVILSEAKNLVSNLL